MCRELQLAVERQHVEPTVEPTLVGDDLAGCTGETVVQPGAVLGVGRVCNGGPPAETGRASGMKQSTPTPELHAAFRVHDPRFADVLGPDPRLELVAEVDAHEGPVYVADEDALYFTTVRRDRVAIKRLDLATGVGTVVRTDANTANGMTLDPEGRLVVCEQGTPETPARISRFDRSTGTWKTLVDAYDDRPLNSPNDLVVCPRRRHVVHRPELRPPPGVPPRAAGRRRRLPHRPDIRPACAVVADGFDKPNGLAFSPDESRALRRRQRRDQHHAARTSTSRPTGTRRRAGRVLAVAARAEHPDGLKVDAEGRVYASCLDRACRSSTPDGELIGEIRLPGAVNFTFGGPDRERPVHHRRHRDLGRPS